MLHQKHRCHGHTFLRVSGSADSVYIVVNKPAGVDLPESGELSDIETVAMSWTEIEINPDL